MFKINVLVLFVALVFSPLVSVAKGDVNDEMCDGILQSAYAPGMAVFGSCESVYEDAAGGELTYKLIIRFQGGILGTPYVLKGRLILDQNGGVKTRWASWTSPLKPINRTFRKKTEKEEWDF